MVHIIVDITDNDCITCEDVNCFITHGLNRLVKLPTIVMVYSLTTSDHRLTYWEYVTDARVVLAEINGHFPVAFTLPACTQHKQKSLKKKRYLTAKNILN